MRDQRSTNHRTGLRLGVVLVAGLVALATTTAAFAAPTPGSPEATAAQVDPDDPGCSALEEAIGTTGGVPALSVVHGLLVFAHEELGCTEEGGDPAPGTPEEGCAALETAMGVTGEVPALGVVHGLLVFAHEELGCAEDDTTTTSSSTTSSSTTTTTEPEPDFAAPLEVPGLREIGRVPFDGSGTEGAVIVDPGGEVGFALVPGSDAARITRFDLGSLEVLAERQLGFEPAWSQVQQRYEPPWAVGGEHLFIPDQGSSGNDVHVLSKETLEETDVFLGPFPSVSGLISGDHVEAVIENLVELVEEGGDPTGRPLLPREPAGPDDAALTGLAYRPAGGELERPKLLVLTEGAFAQAGGNVVTDLPNVVALHQWDAETGRQDWVARLQACRNGRDAATSRWATDLAVSTAPDGTPEAILRCTTRSRTGEVWRVALRPDGSGVASEQLAASVPQGTDALIDTEARRVIVFTASTSERLVGVDLDRRGVDGLVTVSFESGLPGRSSAGLDPETGRVYALARSSEQGNRERGARLLTLDSRISPLPEPRSFPSLNPDDRRAGMRVAVAPATEERGNRVLVRYGGEPFVRVLTDSVPVQQPVPLAAVDERTDDVPERPGETLALFNSNASGYGVRTLFTGGVTTALPEARPGNSTQSFTRSIPAFVSPCFASNREFSFAAVVEGTGLSDTGLTGDAVAATTGSGTVQDVERPVGSCTELRSQLEAVADAADALPHDVRRRLPGGDGESSEGPDGSVDPFDPDSVVGRQWGFSHALCFLPGDEDSSPKPGDTMGDGIPPPPGFAAEVRCGEDGRAVEVHSTASGFEAGPVTVGDSEATTTIRHLDGGGVRVVTEAVVHGVAIEGALRIGRVEARGVSHAAGRDGTARTEYSRRWCGVAAGGEEPDGACLDPDSEDGRAFIDGANQLLRARRYRLEAPPIDPDLAAGTPGGVQAAVQKDRFTSEGDKAFNNDHATAVPALQLVHNHDTPGERGRAIYQLAGIEAGTTYAVNEIPTGPGFDFGPEPGPTTTTTLPPPPPATVPSVQSGQSTGGGRLVREVIAPASRTRAVATEDVGQPLPEPVYAVGRALRWLLRNPFDALRVVALIFSAFAVPLHLFDRRRALTAAVTGGG